MIAPKPQKYQRLMRLRRMTIAAGYVCDSGIVLCADTQETIQGYTKNSAKKLMAFSCPGISLVFAGSGNNATQIDETAHEIAAQVIADEPKNGQEFRKSLRKILEELFPKAHYPRPDGPEVDMLMAVKEKTDATLYRITDCSMAPVRDRTAVGSGVVLALQLLERHYDRTVQISEAAIVCIYVLHHVKKWVDGCGGNTEIALIPKVGDSIAFMPSTDVEKFETYSQAYDDALKGLLLAVPRTPKNLSLFNQDIDASRNALQMARAPFQEWEDTMREVAAHLGVDYEQMMHDSEAAAATFFSAKAKAAMPSTSHTSKDQQ
jgi:20S proteasome alpha/beta subunit